MQFGRNLTDRYSKTNTICIIKKLSIFAIRMNLPFNPHSVHLFCLCSLFETILNPRIFLQSCILHSTVHTTVCAAYYLTRPESTLTCLHANHRGASCDATGSHHNKPTYQPNMFLNHISHAHLTMIVP